LKENLKYLLAKSLYILSDKLFCTLTFVIKNGRVPNFIKPQYFNDKLLYLKLNERNTIMKKLVDKYEVRNYIKENLGEEYLIPLIGVYNNPAEVDFEMLPNKFVIKMTSGSQKNIVCNNKNRMNWDEESRRLSKWLKLDPYLRTREWPYKDLPQRFVIENYIEDKNSNTFDYKFWCFNGKPEFVQIDTNRFNYHRRVMYDMDFNKLNFRISHDNDIEISKPKNFRKMVDVASQLSKDFQFVRIDLYNIDGHIYFGEFTFYPGNCNEKIEPLEYEKKIGEKIQLG
jgi:hypothetical protein